MLRGGTAACPQAPHSHGCRAPQQAATAMPGALLTQPRSQAAAPGPPSTPESICV